jgi:hypothetical protein
MQDWLREIKRAVLGKAGRASGRVSRLREMGCARWAAQDGLCKMGHARWAAQDGPHEMGRVRWAVRDGPCKMGHVRSEGQY